MTNDILHLLVNVMAIIATAGAIYGGIRSDLLNMKEQLRDIKDTALYAHKRIDEHLTAGRRWYDNTPK